MSGDKDFERVHAILAKARSCYFVDHRLLVKQRKSHVEKVKADARQLYIESDLGCADPFNVGDCWMDLIKLLNVNKKKKGRIWMKNYNCVRFVDR